MAYNTVANMQSNVALMNRVSAAVASEVSAGTAQGNTLFVLGWTADRSWDVAATPGWAAKWESAEAGGITDPGGSESVITDADILSRVQNLLTVYPLPETAPVP
jgi:hypothetical protein